MQPCTLWFRFDPFKGWRYSHLEDGHADNPRPEPKVPAQRTAWKGAQWSAKRAWLTDELPARVVHYGPEDA